MADSKSNKSLVVEERVLNVPVAFVELFAINPLNIKKWLVGLKNSKKSIDDMKIKDILGTKVDVSVEKEAFLLDVTFGKDTHKLYIKKPTAENKGLDFILTEGDKFKIETILHLTALDKEKSKINLETKFLEAKSSFHPITSFEIKYFFKKSLDNFIEECEKSYKTFETNEKTIEAGLLSFYQENLKELNNLIDPLKKDLGDETFNDIQNKIKGISVDASDKLSKALETLVSIIPTSDLSLVNDKIIQFVKDHIFVLKNLSEKSHLATLKDLNSVTKLQLDNINFIVPKLLGDIDSEKIVEVEKQLVELLVSIIKDIQDIIEEIRNKIPPQHMKDLEVGFINILRKDLDTSKSILDKIDFGNKALTDKENEILASLKSTLDKYQALVDSKDNKVYTQVLDMSEKALEKLEEEVKTLTTQVTVESIESTKNLVKSTTQGAYKSLSDILLTLTPENLANKEGELNTKIDDILDRYIKAIKLVSPSISDEKLEDIRAKIKDVLKSEYESFCKENVENKV